MEVIETDLYRITFANRGAVVRSWVLRQFEDSTRKPLELLNLRAVAKTGYPFQVRLHDNQDAGALNNALWRMTVSPDKLTVTFDYADGNWSAKKAFRFLRDRYLSDVTSEVAQGGKPRAHLVVWPGGFGDSTVIGAAASQHGVHFDVNENKLVVNAASDAKDAPLVHRGNYSFAGIEDAYFAAVAMPKSPAGFEIRTIRCLGSESDRQQGGVERWCGAGRRRRQPFRTVRRTEGRRSARRISPKLEQLVDFGWFAFLAKPLFLALHWLHDNCIHNYGWSIILITMIINFALLPLKITSLKSMKKMQALQPQIAAINDKYKGIGMRDPKKQEQNQEVMALYKKHGVNPMGGCVPMVLQIPFFIAFYKVLSVAIELRGADWLWVTDLSRPETLGNPRPAARDDRHPVLHAEDDAGHHRRPGAAAHHAVHAAVFRVHVLRALQRPGVILVDRQSGGYRAAVVFQ